MLKYAPLAVTALLAFTPAAFTPTKAQPLSAANYPDKPVKIIVSTSAGGGVDTVSRIVAERLPKILGQPFVVENRGGAGGNLGAEMVYNSDPDGYTLLAAQPAPITTNVTLYKKLSFDPAKLVPIIILSSIPNVLLVRNDFPARTAQEFLAYAKANPGKLNYASQGPGTTSHLTAELFDRLAGTKMIHVPYKGTGPALNDLVAGHVDLIFMQLQAAIKLHEGKRARILAVTTSKRIASLPDIPTFEEVGLKDFISDTWNAIAAPPGTPAAVVNKLNLAMNQALKAPEVVELFGKQHLDVVGGSPEHMEKIVKTETARWAEVIREANIPRI